MLTPDTMNFLHTENNLLPPSDVIGFCPYDTHNPAELQKRCKWTGLGWRQDYTPQGSQEMVIYGEPSYQERHPHH